MVWKLSVNPVEDQNKVRIRSARAESHCGNDDYMNPECSDLGVGYYGTAVIEKDLCEKVSGFLAAARHGEH